MGILRITMLTRAGPAASLAQLRGKIQERIENHPVIVRKLR
jgi:hypothetical protein